MRRETVSLSAKEQQRVKVLNLVERGELTGKQAATLMDLSLRQVRRLLAGYRREGVSALAHGNRGRPPVHRIPESTRRLVVALSQEVYQGLNHSHLQELLVEREQLTLSRASVWRILTASGIASPRKRRPPQHRCRRERYPQEGMLLQVDGSCHDWLEGRGSYLSLVGAIDDATGTVPHALFREQEDAQGYFLLLQGIISNKGIPLALYSDRHSIFCVNSKQPETLEEQLAGARQPTQLGRALKELGIQSILALSPQAKGRIERLWGTFQDRLVSELRLAGATTLEEANQVLGAFLPRFNARFGVPPAQPGSAYRPALGLDLAGVLCFKHQRTVAKDNTIRLGPDTLQLLPGPDRASYTRARVEVQERLDGSLAVCFQGILIASRPAPPHAVTLRADKRTRGEHLPKEKGTAGEPGVPSSPCTPSIPHLWVEPGRNLRADKPPVPKPAPNHPWRKPLLVTKSLNH